MQLVSHLTITSSFYLSEVLIGMNKFDLNYLVKLEPTDEYFTYCSGDIYFLYENQHMLFVKFTIEKKEHILEIDLEKYKSKYNLSIEIIDYDYVILIV
jgi:hypothetical protein